MGDWFVAEFAFRSGCRTTSAMHAVPDLPRAVGDARVAGVSEIPSAARDGRASE